MILLYNYYGDNMAKKKNNLENIINDKDSDFGQTRELHFKNVQDEIDKENKKNEFKKENKPNKALVVLKVLFLLGALGICYLFILYKLYKSRDAIDRVYVFMNYGLFGMFCTFFIATVLFIKTKIKNVLGIFTTLILIAFASFNILVEASIINLPRQGVIPDFTNKPVNEALLFASQHNIEVNQTLEYSDNIADTYVITQDVKPNTLIKKTKKINLVVSNGPDYTKDVLVNDMVGLTIDDLIKFINENHLNNVTINYVVSDTVKRDIIISQSYKGEMKRNTAITFEVSLGRKEDLKPVSIEDFTNKTLFDATLWLKRNGINYKIEYEFSDTIKKGLIIRQSIKAKDMVDPNSDTVTLVISKGKKIVVPNLMAMNVDDIVKWIVENNLKIKYKEEYNSYAKEGVVIGSSAREGDAIEEGTTITITTSKGQIKFPSFNSLAEFKSWASNYGIKYNEEYEYSDKVAAGGIISFSLKTGDVVILEDTIKVKVSYGKAITVPNFVGMSKNDISNKCYSLGLNCTFYYIGYNSTPADVATSQSVTSGNKVVNGTYISIALSNGPAKSFTVFIQNTWFYPGNPDGTINSLRSILATEAPGVTFNFVKKKANDGTPGYIHPDSPIKGGNNTFTQGQTYTIWVIE